MNRPRLSVLIRTLNEQRWLEPLLRSLRAQTLPGIEVVVVDSGSTDGTVEVARRHADKVLEILADSFSFGYALNVGVAACTADLVAIVSAHTLPMSDGWLEALSAPFGDDPSRSNVVLAYGMQRGRDTSHYAECRDMEERFPDRSDQQSEGDWFCNNANSLIRKDLWSIHPFDETLSGLEDIAWARHWTAKGLSVKYVAEGGVYHIHEETWPQVYNRFRREAIALGMMGLPGEGAVAISLGEAARSVRDAAACAARFRWDEAAGSILYRWWKTKGTIDGQRVGRTLATAPELADATQYHALEIRGDGKAGIVTRDLPDVKPNEVLIRVAYVGICQTDLEVLHQTLGYYRQGRAQLPIIPGHEYSGVVARVGANVRSLKPGDPVVGECILSCGSCSHCLANRLTACGHRREVGVINYDGGCADYVLLAARFVHRLPDGFPLLTACTVEPLAVVIKGFQRVGLRPAREVGRRRVLVVGAGAIGNLCCQAAAHWGHVVEVVDPHEERRGNLGTVCEKTHAQLPELGGFDYIIEATGVLEVGEKVLTTTAAGCHLLFLGFPYGTMHWNLEGLVANDLRAVGSVGSNFETFEAAIEMLPHLNFDVFNHHVLDFWDWGSAYDLQKAKKHLKIKLRIAGEPTGQAPGAPA
jgi:threonine dehydrogenase-like Zn-dependent dehydrogenase